MTRYVAYIPEAWKGKFMSKETSEFDEAYEKFRREHINASFMQKDMALAMWQAAQKALLAKMPSDETINNEMVKFVKRKDSEGSLFPDVWGAGFAIGAEWLRDSLLGEKK